MSCVVTGITGQKSAREHCIDRATVDQPHPRAPAQADHAGGGCPGAKVSVSMAVSSLPANWPLLWRRVAANSSVCCGAIVTGAFSVQSVSALPPTRRCKTCASTRYASVRQE